jgi:hypothetical protein
MKPIYNFIAVLVLIVSINACKPVDETTTLTDPRGELVSKTLVASYTPTQVDSMLAATGNSVLSAIDPLYTVDFYKLIYKTIDPSGNLTTASGALILPRNCPDDLRWASYQHGTVLEKNDVPSRFSQETIIGIVLGSGFGFAVSEPDYLGLGDSPGLHPYMHGKSQATASVDMLRASRKVFTEQNAKMGDKLFLFGYSQGGHATMALLKELETYHSTEFKVTAASPMAGPYDTSGYQAETISSDEAYPAPYYLPYIALSYNSVYKIYPSIKDFLKPPYDSILPPLFDGYHSAGDVDAVMPNVPSQIIRSEVLNDFRYNYANSFREVLRKNDLYEWKPKAQIRMCHCEGDDHVVYQNALVAKTSFEAKGANNVELFNPGNFGHGDCAVPCLIDALSFMLTFP